MDGKTLLAYALIAAMGVGAIGLAISFVAKRRAFRIRQKGRGKQ